MHCSRRRLHPPVHALGSLTQSDGAWAIGGRTSSRCNHNRAALGEAGRRGWGAGGWVHAMPRAAASSAHSSSPPARRTTASASPSVVTGVLLRVRPPLCGACGTGRRGAMPVAVAGCGCRGSPASGRVIAVWLAEHLRWPYGFKRRSGVGRGVGSNLSRRVWPARCVEIRSLLHLASICGQPGLPQWRGSSARSRPVMRQACRAHHR